MVDVRKDPLVELSSIYTGDADQNNSCLYQLLAERQSYESISHSGMPTFNQHVDFIQRRPYKFWGFVVQGEGNVVGSVYLTFSNEIGIAIFNRYRRLGYGRAAIRKLIAMHPNESYFLANINPTNAKSILLFKDLGFGIIQETYKLDMECNNVVP